MSRETPWAETRIKHVLSMEQRQLDAREILGDALKLSVSLGKLLAAEKPGKRLRSLLASHNPEQTIAITCKMLPWILPPQPALSSFLQAARLRSTPQSDAATLRTLVALLGPGLPATGAEHKLRRVRQQQIIDRA